MQWVCYDLIYKGVMVALMKWCKNVNEMKEWKKVEMYILKFKYGFQGFKQIVKIIEFFFFSQVDLLEGDM